MSVVDRFRLGGRIALVTGGAGPLFGSSISEALVEAGATLITASRSVERNERFVDSLRTREFDAHAMQVDIEVAESIDRLHRRVIEQFGRLDVLVNSAVARGGHTGRFEEQTLEQLQASAGGDFLGLFRICQRFIATMAEQKQGSIVNIASIYGTVANDPTLSADTEMVQPASYNFVKAGMITFTRSIESPNKVNGT